MISEDRLRQLLSAEADTYEPSGPSIRRVRRRVQARHRARVLRRSALVAAAVLAAIVVPLVALNRQPLDRLHVISPAGFGSATTTTPSTTQVTTPKVSTTTPPSTRAPATTTAPSTSVPTASPTTAPSPPTTAPPPTTAAPPPCQASQLLVSAGRSGVAGGNYLQVFVLTNQSSTACTLDGYPDIAFEDSNSKAITAPTSDGGAYTFQSIPPQTVTLGPQADASFDIGGADFDAAAQEACPTSSTVLVTVPNASAQIPVAAQVSVCPEGTAISPVVAGDQGVGP